MSFPSNIAGKSIESNTIPAGTIIQYPGGKKFIIDDQESLIEFDG